MKNNKKGFTLVELLSVIVLIALVSVLAVSGITSANNKTKQRILSSKIVTVEEGLRSWNMDNENCFRSRDAINCIVGLANGCTADQNIVSCSITIGELARQNIIEVDQEINGEKIVINPVDKSSLNNEPINFTYDSAKRIFIFEDNLDRILKVSTTTKNNRSTTTSIKANSTSTTTTNDQPTVSVVATKIGTNTEVPSGKWSDSFLSIKFASTSNSPIFYCVDKTNNCTPNTSISNNGSFNLSNVASAIYYVRYRIENNSEIGIFQARLDFDAPSKPTMTFVDGDWNTYTSESKSYRTLYAAQAAGRSDNTCDTQKGAPSGSVDELSGVSKYQISRNNTNWEDYNYDCANNTLGNTLYKMMSYEKHTRYFRACDKAGNCSGATTVSATIENTKPTISVTTFKYNFFDSNNGNLGELVKLPEVYTQDTTYIVSDDWIDYNTIFMINSLSPVGIKSIEYKMNEDGVMEDTGDSYPKSATADGNGEESVVRFPVLLDNGYRKMQWTATSTDDKKTTITIIAKINVPTPIATIKAYKKGTNDVVPEGTKSDTGLDYIITKGENINSNVKIYYCKETATTLCPSDFTKWEETTSGERITTYNDDTTPYTIRYLVLSEYRSFYQGMYSARFKEDNILTDKIKPASCQKAETTPGKTYPGRKWTETNEGMLCTEYDYGTSYYYRGTIENNYLVFANKCWRIVRIDGLGNIKLVLQNNNGTNCSESNIPYAGAFNNFSGTDYDSYIGFMYGTPNSNNYNDEHENKNDSAILTKLKSWYDEAIINKGLDNYLADVIWCNDKSLAGGYFGKYTRPGYSTPSPHSYYGGRERLYHHESGTVVVNEANPSLKCPTSYKYKETNYNIGNLSRFTAADTINGNGKLKGKNGVGDKLYKVGLLTGDEVAFAGGMYEVANHDTLFYLENGKAWWTMTPWGVSESDSATIVIVEFGELRVANSNKSGYYLRPAISLKPGVQYALNGTGEAGSKTNPYIINGIVEDSPLTVAINAYKIGTNKGISSGEASDTGLDFIISHGPYENGTIKIYYCKDTVNKCNPNIEVNNGEKIQEYNKIVTNYYIRYKAVSSTGISTDIKSYNANFIFENFKDLLLDKIKPASCQKAETTPGKTYPGREMATTNEGILCTEDDYGTSYYYRGVIENNYLLFANKCWRIVRIDGLGNIKLILQNNNGTNCNESNLLTSLFNSDSPNINDNNHYNGTIGFMYGTLNSNNYNAEHENINDSGILTQLKSWYDKAIISEGLEHYLADVIWCNDKSLSSKSKSQGYGTSSSLYGGYERLALREIGGIVEKEANPSLKCPTSYIYNGTNYNIGNLSRFTAADTINGNGKLRGKNGVGNKLYKIGLLTADEVAFAGGTYLNYNTYYYLNNGKNWWTMTPFGIDLGETQVFASRHGAIYPEHITSADFTDPESDFHLRPAISLKSGVKYALNGTGEAGSKTNPYIVNYIKND